MKIHNNCLPLTNKTNKNSLGFAIHADETGRALRRRGVIFDESADIVFNQLPAFCVEKIPDKLNVLYTACETSDLPQRYIDGASQMDIILCVSEFASCIFRKYIKNKPIYTVPLGVDSNIFRYVKRKKSSPFIFLWVGAPNLRKGWDILGKVWKRFIGDPDYFLIMKSTGNHKVISWDNAIIEGRKFTQVELSSLYAQSNAFIFPSYGEGFGLPLAEAMATGLPSIFVPWGGVCEYASKKTAFPVDFKMVPVDYSIRTMGAEANIDSLEINMRKIADDYKRSVVRAKEGARLIKKHFTWDTTACKILEILKKHGA